MTYTINTFDGNFLTNVSPGTVDTTASSLTLLGKNYSGYGALVASNFVYLTENFAKTSAPANPLKGQLWYDKSENMLKVCGTAGDANSFKRLGVTVSASEPASSLEGDLFFDTGQKQLKVKSGSAFINATTPGDYGAKLEFVKVTSTTDITSTDSTDIKTVVAMVVRDPALPTATITADMIIAVWAQETFWFKATEPSGQGEQDLVTAVHGATDTDASLANNSKLTRGMNVNTAYTDATVNQSSDSIKLGGQLPSYYLDYANFTNSAVATFVKTDGNSLPNSDNSHNIGSGSARFANIYSTTFIGDLTGNASTATNSTQLNGNASTFYTNAGNLASGTVPSGRLTGTYAISISGTAANATDSASLGGVSAAGYVSTSGNQTVAGIKTFSNDVIMSGNLTINGTTTTVNTTTVSIEDNIMQLASGNSGASATYIGIQAERGATDAYFVWEESSDKWRATTSADGTTHTDADFQCATLTASTGMTAVYADIAERFHTDEVLEAGTLVEIGGVNEVTKTKTFCSTNVFGVVSKDPALKMNSTAGTSTTHPYVALSGRLDVKVVGRVNKGDRLIASEVEGVAQALRQDFIRHCKDTNSDAYMWGVVGRALETKETDGIGLVEAYIQARA
jgi:hypothetical protein